MAATNVRGRQLRDDDVMRADLNTTVSGSAVIRRILLGAGVAMSSTGVDSGTGDVTIALSTSGVTAGSYGSSTLVPIVTVDTYGRVTSITTTTISGGGGGGGSSVRCEQTITATANQTSFSGLTCTLTAGYFDVFINGVKVNSSSFSNTSTSITFTDGLAVGDIVDIVNYGIFSTSITTANGFTGTVANSTTTPAITLSISVNGIIKGSGGSLVAAVAGTDFQAPIILTTTGSSGAASFSTNTLNIPTYTLAGLGGQPGSPNLTSLSGLTFVSTSFVKMTAAGTFALDTNTYALTNQTMFIGTTSVTINRASTALSLTGVSIDGNAGTVTNGLYLISDQTITGQKTFPSAIANRPIFPGGIISAATGDVDADIWGISELYYPSNPTAADAWGIRWNALNNELQFVGGGTNRAIIDLDQGNITGAAFIVSGGTASQFLKANGSVDANTYYLASNPSGYTTNAGTVTSVSGAGTVSGLTLTGTVTTTGSLTLGGTLTVTASNFSSQTANTFLAAPNGSAGVTTFRTIAAADIPTLNQNTTGSAGSVTNSFIVRADSGTTEGTDIYTFNGAAAKNINFVAGTGVTITKTAGQWTIAAPGGTGTVTSIGMTAPTGLSVSPASITTSGIFAVTFTAGYSIPTTTSQTNWDSAFSERRQWDGGSTNLVAATGRASLGATTVGSNLFTLTNPTAVTFLRINADNTLSTLDAATFRTAIGAGTSSTTGTVTSVSGTGTVSGLTLTGTVTTSGSLTLGGTLSASIDNITDEHRLFNNMGDSHSTRTSFDATTPSYNFGWRFVQGILNGPAINSATQYYQVYVGLGNDYPATGAGSYGMQIAIPRNVSTPYIAIRYNENNVLATWQKISAGYADTAGNSTTVTSITSGQVTTALGYTPYNSTNPNGYTSNTGTVTSVGATGTVSGLTLTGTVTGSGNLTLGGTLTLTSGNVTTALGYTPYNSTNPSGYTSNVGTVTSVAALTIGTTGTDITSTVTTGNTAAVITLNIPTASAANRGALSAADWSTFNGKQAALNGTGFVKATGTTISYDNSTYQSTAEKGVANGYASLNSSGQVPAGQLPSYVDDVLEFANLAAFPATGEAGKIYVTADTNKTYRWTGTVYVEISASPGSTDVVTEGTTNLYFTNARARAAVSFTAGSGAYNSSTGIFTIPTNTNQLTNGAGFITGYTETDTLATVAARGNTTTANIGAVGASPINFVTAGNTGTWIGGVQDATTGWSLGTATIGFKSDNATYAAIGIAAAGGPLYFSRTTASGVGTLASWLEVSSTGIANFKLARPQYNGSNLALVSELPTVNNATLTMNVSGNGLTGSQTFTANQSTAATFTVTSNATNANTPSTVVFRDASGNFSAGNITGAAFIVSGGTASQFLKANGSVDANTYYLASNPSGYTANTGTVTTVSVTTANGISGSVATAGTTPAISLTLGAITPTSVNSVVISGSATPTLTVTGTSSISGSNTGDNAVNSLYSGLVSNATHTGDATGSTALTVAGLRGVALPALGVSAGFLRYTGTGTNTWTFDSSTYLTAAITSLGGLTAATQTFANDTNVTISSATSTHTLGWTGQLSVARGGTGASTLTGVLIGNGTSAVTSVTGTASQLLRRNADNTAYEFFTHNFLPTTGGTLTGNLGFGNATSPFSNYIQFGDNTGWIFRFMTNVAGVPTQRFSFSDGGAFSAVGQINGSSLLIGVGASVLSKFTLYSAAAGQSVDGISVVTYNTPVGVGHVTRLYTDTAATTGFGRSLIYAASPSITNGGGQLDVLIESGGSFISRLGSVSTGSSNSFGVFTIAGVETIRLDTNGTTFLNGGNVSIGSGGSPSKLFAFNTNIAQPTILATTESSLGSLQTTTPFQLTDLYNSGLNGHNLIVTSTASTGLWEYNITQTFGGHFTIGVAVGGALTRDFYLYSGGQLRLAKYTTTTSFTGTAVGVLAFTSDGTIIPIATPGGGSGLTGSGTNNYIPKFTSGTSVGNSVIFDNGTDIGINTATPTTLANYKTIDFIGGTTGALIRFCDSTATFRGAIYGSTAETAINAVSQFNLYVNSSQKFNVSPTEVNAYETIYARKLGAQIQIAGAVGTLSGIFQGATNILNIADWATASNGLAIDVGNGVLYTRSSAAGGAYIAFQRSTSVIYGYVGNSSLLFGAGYNATNAIGIRSEGDINFGTAAGNATAKIASTGQLKLALYTTTTSFTGTAVGVLAFDSTGNIITIATPGGGGYTVVSQTANYTETATSGTNIIKCNTTSASFTVTLPTAVGNTATIIIKKMVAANTLTVDGAGSETIDSALTAVIYDLEESITLISDNANWLII